MIWKIGKMRTYYFIFVCDNIELFYMYKWVMFRECCMCTIFQ